MSADQITKAIGTRLDAPELERRISLLSHDFNIEIRNGSATTTYYLGQFRAFLGQDDHTRHEQFLKYRAKIS
jgi:DNA (cytosine-5)-methyltransferase 1